MQAFISRVPFGSRVLSHARVLPDSLNERYRNSGTMREAAEPRVRDLVDEMNFAARDHRVLANQLAWMYGNDGDMQEDEGKT